MAPPPLARLSPLLLLALPVALAPLPTASAHECYAEAGTPAEASCATECVDGEAHHHQITHLHDDGEHHVHYDCVSSAQDPPPPSEPRCWIEIGPLCIHQPPGVQSNKLFTTALLYLNS